MHENQQLTIGRVTRVLEERLRPAIHAQPHPLELARHTVGGEPIPVSEGIAASFEPMPAGSTWGRAWDTTWFRITGEVPAAFAGRRVEIVADLGFDVNMPGFQAEGLVYRPDGAPVRSLNPRAQWIPVTPEARGGESIEFYIEAASNPVLLDYHPFLPTEQGDSATATDEELYRLRRVDACVFEEEVFELVHDVEVLVQLAQQLGADSARRSRILRALDKALDRVDLQDIAGTAAAGRAELREVLTSPAEPSAHRLTAVGHAHIDSAWLWPLRETVRKVARTSSSMVTLLEEDDEFVYAMSSAQQYDWLKRERPEVFARVKEAVAAGRFVPIGGMWVEPDAVLPSGESFIRQISYGQRFFREEFGVECRGAWLPDSFGYSGSLPQILVGAGFDWFLTQKISWNQVNRFPHHSFLWEGIDGSRIFTHFPPMDTYNAQLSGEEVARAARQFKEKAVATSSLAPTGWGDGGGGTTREMLARGKRMADLEGSPRVVFESPDAFFDRAMAELPDPAVWRGELYLELHRGTFTTQHKTKQGNRRSEQLLAEAELWGAVAAVRAGYAFPHDEVDDLWREVLLLQFHDILPGTSIAWVHREAEERYAEIARRLEAIIADALAALGVDLDDVSAAGRSDAQRTLVNSAPVTWNGAPGAAVSLRPTPVPRAARREGDRFVLESEHVKIEIDGNGHVVSAVDLALGRDAVPPGERGNLLQLHQDFPNMWDAWDVDAHYLDMRQDLDSGAVVDLDGAAVTVATSFGESSIRQRLFLADDGRTLLIDNTVEWAETEKFLKLAFPVDVFADHAVAETQFGVHSRTTHTNTSWEDARFETQAQRWFLVEEPGFGVAFLNDSSHGFDVQRVKQGDRVSQLARFSMLRAPRFPDPRTDRGTQTMRFGVLVGADVGSATEAAIRLNTPARHATGAVVSPLATSTNPAVVISAVKLADDRSGDVIVRLYESRGGRARTEVRLDAPGLGTISRTDLIERPVEAESVATTVDEETITVTLELRPFEVVTLRLSR
ncbi:alpha-mannosidase [Diaminobutyricimonas aerilata]|uniref:Alpha-mannosidase n=1 Tax=Diaminobutyricimonas aerilata TaxID=1162967 RepID=A0A2M9CHZ7_9MICO|nr:glycoside hydrolase family 38 C-terminal domain-containing protein [Diaminobutyricimonas aerilata]PJJ71546.1 alpha-mannosidase [Diaminobutyricimonas aerilata]